jgi:DNA end-binding protein Ku
MARATWKGIVRIGKVAVPVKLYSAVRDRTVHFRLLHAKDETPVREHMVHPETGDEVPREEIRKGYEVEPGVFVLIDDDELDAVAPRESRDIEITRFVKDASIDHRWYERPYWLGPDGGSAERSYAALAAALEKTGREGVAHWTMRARGYVGALRVAEGRLCLIALRNRDEVIPVDAIPAPRARAFGAKELRLAEQLVDALAADFDPERWHDEYRARVEKLIEAKRRGRRVKTPRERRPRAPKDLEAALQASLRATARERKSA